MLKGACVGTEISTAFPRNIFFPHQSRERTQTFPPTQPASLDPLSRPKMIVARQGLFEVDLHTNE